MSKLTVSSPSRKRSRLINEVVDQVISIIADRKLEPGDRLPTEHELMEMLQVGRSSVREALMALEIWGIIDRPTTGTRLSEASSAAMTEYFLANVGLGQISSFHIDDARGFLEAQLGLHAVTKITDDDLLELENICKKLESLGPGNNEEYISLDKQLHKKICEVAGNPILTRMWEVSYDLFIRMRLPPWITKDFIELSNRRHRRLVDALRTRDESIVEAAISASLQLGQARPPDGH